MSLGVCEISEIFLRFNRIGIAKGITVGCEMIGGWGIE
jgi:hypothetical protein